MSALLFGPLAALGTILGAALIGSIIAEVIHSLRSRKFTLAGGPGNVRRPGAGKA